MNAISSFWDAAAWPLFTVFGAPVTLMEAAGFVLAVAMVLFNMRVNPLGWPLAILSSLLYCAVFAHSKLYGEAALQIVFAVLGAWGWWQWLRGRGDDGQSLGVRRIGARGVFAGVAFVLLAWPLLGWLLQRHTDSDVPYWDAFPTVASLLGQYLLGRKYVENWPTWLVVNIASVALYMHKGLWLTVLLYAWFVLMSGAGWRAWLKLAPVRRPAAA